MGNVGILSWGDDIKMRAGIPEQHREAWGVLGDMTEQEKLAVALHPAGE